MFLIVANLGVYIMETFLLKELIVKLKLNKASIWQKVVHLSLITFTSACNTGI